MAAGRVREANPAMAAGEARAGAHFSLILQEAANNHCINLKTNTIIPGMAKGEEEDGPLYPAMPMSTESIMNTSVFMRYRDIDIDRPFGRINREEHK